MLGMINNHYQRMCPVARNGGVSTRFEINFQKTFDKVVWVVIK